MHLPRLGWTRLLCLAVAIVLARPALAQDPDLGAPDVEVESEATRKLRELQTAGKAKDKDAEKLKPPFEFYRAPISPSDVQPYVKARHWSMVLQELQANLVDYEGTLRTAPQPLAGMPQTMVYERDARLRKEQTTQLPFPIYVSLPKNGFEVELARPGALRPDGSTLDIMRPLSTHQMQIVILARDPSPYARWNRSSALVPLRTDRTNATLLDDERYYRLIIYQDPEKTGLSDHSLTWSTVSHVIWDDFDPRRLRPGQQQAILDWLHWGGQLVISGASLQALASVSDDESFLARVVPGVPTGESKGLTADDLKPLAELYRPLYGAFDRMLEEENQPSQVNSPDFYLSVPRYGPPVEIKPPPGRSLLVHTLRKTAADAVELRTATDDGEVIALERRIGRGRVLMLGFDPHDSALVQWLGNATFVRRFYLRRPEDPGVPEVYNSAMLAAPALTWYRLTARDWGAEALTARRIIDRANPRSIEAELPTAEVASWSDDTSFPTLCRDQLVRASGIRVPDSMFVLRVLAAYLIALVPANWLICRYLIGRRELAWAVAPLLALGFAIGVERAAALDLGYETACDEVDLLELQPGYSRGHLSRIAAVASTGRLDLETAFPDGTMALALPFDAKRSIRGETGTQATWTASPTPALRDLRVEPRSLAMLRSEQMVDLGGGIVLMEGAEGRQVANQTQVALKDAIFVDEAGPTYLGAIPAGGTVNLDQGGVLPDPETWSKALDWLDLWPFVNSLRDIQFGGPEGRGGIRLVAWAETPYPGATMQPAPDRHRGVTLVLAHLKHEEPPPPSALEYNQVTHAAPPQADSILRSLSPLVAPPRIATAGSSPRP